MIIHLKWIAANKKTSNTNKIDELSFQIYVWKYFTTTHYIYYSDMWKRDMSKYMSNKTMDIITYTCHDLS